MPTNGHRIRSRTSMVWLALMVAALTAILAACGGGTSSADKTATAGAGGKTPAAGTATKAATSAAGTGGTITVKKGDALKLGLSTTLTTDNAQLGLAIQNGAKLAVKEKPTIKGFTVTLDAQDDLCSGPGSVDAANKLISDKVVAVVGPMCSGGAVAALDPYSKENLLVVSSSATNPSVTQQGKKDFFRTAWNDATQGGEMAKFAYNVLGKKNAVLVNDQSVYGKGLMDVFKKSFTDLGGKVASEEAVTVGEKDFGPTVTKIKGESPDIVVFGGFIAEGAILVRQLSEAGVTATFMGADGIADQKYIDQAGGKAEGSYVSRGPKPTDTTLYDKFAAAHKTEFGTDPGQFADYTYDAVNIVLAALDKVATVDANGDLVIDKDKLIAAVRATDYTGTSGKIQFNDVGDRTVVGAVNEIDQVKDGKLTRVQ
ncbi:MAG: branched-chain amino acid ABC transporter substrate-binding protein [Dehalococcoidia bacterium]|nr:MAG: branched-chain amino acid ABC transporter substrate-binding protein [Dehalococcoidia bacterium]